MLHYDFFFFTKIWLSNKYIINGPIMPLAGRIGFKKLVRIQVLCKCCFITPIKSAKFLEKIHKIADLNLLFEFESESGRSGVSTISSSRSNISLQFMHAALTCNESNTFFEVDEVRRNKENVYNDKDR